MVNGNIIVFKDCFRKEYLAIFRGKLAGIYRAIILTKLEVTEENIKLLSEQRNDIWELHELTTEEYTLLRVVGHNPNFE